MSNRIEQFEKLQLKKKVPEFSIGDTVDVHVRIIEGDKERVQVFTGTVISRKGTLNRENFTVRRIVAGEGVERVFPLHSPWINDIRIRRAGKVRRAKLYYLRDRVGKATKVRERMSFEKARTGRRLKKKGAGTPQPTVEKPAPASEEPASEE